MNRKKVFVSLSQFCEADEAPRKLLLDAGFEVIENRTGRRLQAGELPVVLEGIDAVLAAVEPYSAELLGQLPGLKCISRCGAGVDAIDLQAAKKNSITVLATRDEVAEPVAQMTLGFILALSRNMGRHFHDFQNREWKKHTGYLLREWTIGVVGFGKIGKKVVEYLKPFGCQIEIADPFSDQATCTFKTLLAKSDLVTLHVGRDPKEGALFSFPEFERMKRGSYFVNTARGYLVDEAALEKFLKNGHLAGAALDVFEQEPYRGDLAHLPQVIATPHVATLTVASRAAMELKAAQNIVDFFSSVIPAEAGIQK